MTCRVCGNSETSILPVGKYAEFFRLRIDTTQDEFLLFSRADSIPIRAAPRSGIEEDRENALATEAQAGGAVQDINAGMCLVPQHHSRSEERRVGTECSSLGT